MSKDKKEDRSEFTFIKEQIVPRKRSKAKKALISVSSTLGLAVVFGVVARVAFSVSEPLVDKLLGLESGKKPVTITTSGSGDSTASSDEVTTDESGESLNTTVTSGNDSTQSVTGTEANSNLDLSDTVEGSEYEEDDSTEDADSEQVVNNYYIQNKIDADVDDYTSMYTALRKVAEEAMDSLVTVTGIESTTDWSGDAYEIDEQIPGLIVGENGVEYLILTSYTELKDSSTIQVTFDGDEKTEGKIASYDKDTNLAIVSVPIKTLSEETTDQIVVAELGESYGVHVATPVLAIGAPNGICDSLAIGMITNDSGCAYVTDRILSLFYLDITATESSNGFILNTKGNVIGIIANDFSDNVTTSNTTVLGISKVKTLIENLVNEEDRVYFGVLAEDMPEEALEEADIEKGIYVTEVSAKSPAYEAGIQSGDIILTIDDTTISNMNTFRNTIDEKEIKTEITVTIKRVTNGVGEEKTVKVTLGKKTH